MCRLCFGWFVCPGLWAVVVCVAVRIVPRRGPVCACAVSFGASWLFPVCACRCLSCCGVVVCSVFYPVLCGVLVLGSVLAWCCWSLLPLPGPLSWPVAVFCPGPRCCVALVCRLSCAVLLSASCFTGCAVLFCSNWLVLCAVACGCRVLVEGFGCLVFFFAGVCCRWCSRLAACPAVCCGLWWCPALPCCVPCAGLPCGNSYGALLSVFLCWWCWFVSFSCVSGAVLRCASCCSVPVWSALLLLPCAMLCCCVLWCLPWRSLVWWCCSAVLWCLVVACRVLWCCVALWCRVAGLCSLAPLMPAGVVCCCLLCLVVCCWAGSPLLSPGCSWCRVPVVLSLSRQVARRPVVWSGVSWCSAPLCCVLWCCAVVWRFAVVLCCLFASLPVPVVCFLPLRFLLCVSWCTFLWSICLLWRLAPLCCVLWCCAVVFRCLFAVLCVIAVAFFL